MAVAISAQNLSKTFANRTLFRGVGLSVDEQERVALIGPNGSGKSTLLKIIAGMETADEGTITVRRGVRVAYVAQADVFPKGSTVRSAVVAAVAANPPPALHDDHEFELAADLALGMVGFEDLDRDTATLSGGQRKRLAIARALALSPDVLLLDEPTNHLDVEGIRWLEELLSAQQREFASVVVTHDRAFLEGHATRIVELSRSYPEGTFAVSGNYSEFLRRKQEFLDGQARQEQALANQVRDDLRWLSRGAKARRTKSKSRIDASHGRIDELAELRARNAPHKAAGIDWSATERRTHKLLVGRALTKSLGGRLLFRDLDILLSPGDKLGLIGPNGSGKSTFIKVLTGEIEPDAPTPEAIAAAADDPPNTPAPGTIRRADKLRTVLFSQARTELDLSLTLGEALSPHSDSVIYQGRSVHIVTWARRFLFDKGQLNAPVRSLSGGEQARIHIARLMLEPADVLILDEPTNDLDIPSLEVLEDSLEEFPGAVVLVTHDRAMIADLATRVLALDGRGKARYFADYDQWERLSDHVEEEETPVWSTPAPVKTAPAPAKQKLSYKEQRELEGIEPQIHAAEARVTELEASMADPGVVADRKRYEGVCKELAQVQGKIASLYERWTALEAKRS